MQIRKLFIKRALAALLISGCGVAAMAAQPEALELHGFAQPARSADCGTAAGDAATRRRTDRHHLPPAPTKPVIRAQGDSALAAQCPCRSIALRTPANGWKCPRSGRGPSGAARPAPPSPGAWRCLAKCAGCRRR